MKSIIVSSIILFYELFQFIKFHLAVAVSDNKDEILENWKWIESALMPILGRIFRKFR